MTRYSVTFPALRSERLVIIIIIIIIIIILIIITMVFLTVSVKAVLKKPELF